MSDLHPDDACDTKKKPHTTKPPPGTTGVGSLPTTRRKSVFQKLAQTTTQTVHARRLTKALVVLAAETPDEQIKPKPRLENTYKMKPDDGQVFSAYRVKQEMHAILEEHLLTVEYDSKTCGKLCCDISLAMKNRIKDLNFPRYKIVCNVIMGPCFDQGLEAASRSVWDSKTDNFACVTYKNKSLFAIGIVHGIFLE